MLEYLLRPFSYWKIDHSLKRQVDWTLPVVLALLSVLVVWYATRSAPISIYGETGLLARVLSFVQSLPGFYIAALAAIATFNKTDIDRHMPEPTPVLETKIQGKTALIKLTRRRFLCAMFAFLTAESLLIIILTLFGLSVAAAAKVMLTEYAVVAFKYAFLFLVMTLLWQMIVTTFWGLYYLGEKLHQPDQVPPQP